MTIPSINVVNRVGHITKSDCLSEEYSRRRIYITGDITYSLAAEICIQINHLASVNEDDIILWIMSPGGSVNAGLAIIDTMKSCGCDIQTIAMGAASIASIVASSGTKGKRYIGLNSELMITQILEDFTDQMPDIPESTHIEKSNKRLYKILAENCKVSIQQMISDCNKGCLDAEEAIRYGLADHIFAGFER